MHREIALLGLATFVCSPMAGFALGHWAWGTMTAGIGLLAFSLAITLMPDNRN